MFLALSGRMTRLRMTQWLQENGVQTHEASDWNDLTLNLQEPCKIIIESSHTKYSNPHDSNFQGSISSIFIIIIDIGFLDLSTEIWEQQLDFLDKYRGLASFAWILNHDTSNAIKAELRKRGHLLMVNRPLYKAKMIQIFESVTRENVNASQIHEFLEIDTLHLGSTSSDDSEKSENECFKRTNSVKRRVEEQYLNKSSLENQSSVCSHKVDKNPLDGLHILLAEDTLVLQRVATIMLEKMGAKVVVVGDGIQVLDALNNAIQSHEYGEEVLHVNCTTSHTKSLPYDLILMDCQVSFDTGSFLIPRRGREGEPSP